MHKLYITFLVLGILLAPCSNFAQSQQTEAEYERLFYLCKVWGYYKYFHPSLANCTASDWDFVLIQAIEEIQQTPNEQGFQFALRRLETFVLPIVPPTIDPPTDGRLNLNLDLSWHSDPKLSRPVQANLAQIRENFRLQPHCQLESTGNKSTTSFANESPYSNMVYPSEDYRLLSLFRFWNAVNYFYPYKQLMDNSWDETLGTFIPRIIAAQDARAYQLEMMALFKEIQDSHLIVLSPAFNKLIGFFYAPFDVEYIDNQTVISSVLNSDLGIKQGDIITEIDGHSIQKLRDSLSAYASGGNTARVAYQVNEWIIRGLQGPFAISIKNDAGPFSYTLTRYLDASTYEKILPREDEFWKRLPGNYGYIEASRLDPSLTTQTLSRLQRKNPKPTAIIIDLRNMGTDFYPDLSLQFMDKREDYALRSEANAYFPGTFQLPVLQKTSTRGIGYDGQLILLIDESTVGGAELTAMSLEPYEQLVKIGSPTAGSASGELALLRLVGGISVLFKTTLIQYPDGSPIHRVGIKPDIEISPTIESIRAGQDVLLDAAIIQAKSTALAPSVLAFPNPTLNELQLLIKPNSTNIVQIDILDFMGRLIKRFEHSNAHATIKFDISDLQKGYYLVRTQDGDKIALTRFQKQ